MRLVKEAEPQPGSLRSAPVTNPQARAAIWAFYNSNPDRVLLTVGGFIKIRVRDLRILFVAIAGPEN